VEARGVPTVVLGTDAFLSLARAQAAKKGMPHLPVSLVAHATKHCFQIGVR
jgi:hypothetical protein